MLQNFTFCYILSKNFKNGKIMKLKFLFVSILCAMHYTNAADIELSASLKGSTSVDSLGVLNYNLPLSLPPSIYGFSPELNLNYNGQANDGVLGQGWGISGLSSISRCVDDSVYDEKKIGVSIFAATIYEYILNISNKPSYLFSPFCLDGKRLIPTSSDTGTNTDMEFHLENDDFSKIKLEVTTGTTGSLTIPYINKFIVTQKDGIIREYGARVKLNKKNLQTGQYENLNEQFSFMWGLNSVKDINGNYWTIDYLDSATTGALYPSAIKYTGNGSVLPLNSIEFDYINRPENEKKITFVENGSATIIDKKLAKINIKINNVLKSEYNFQYETIDDNTANKNRLKTIKYCSIVGANRECLLPLNFGWSSYGKDNMSYVINSNLAKIPNTAKQVQLVKLHTKKNDDFQNTIGLAVDANILTIYDSNLMNGEGQNLTLTHATLGKFKEWSPIVMDVNGDGIEDLVIYGKDSSNNVSLLEFTSAFGTDGKRTFTFYKEISNFANVSAPLHSLDIKDGNYDGVNDLNLTFIDSSMARFYSLKLDQAGNKTSLDTIDLYSSILSDLKSKIDGGDIGRNLLKGRFNRDGTSDTLIYYTDSNGLNFCALNLQDFIYQNKSEPIPCSDYIIINGTEGQSYKNYDFSVVDYNHDGLDDIIISKVIRVDAANGTSTRFKDKIIILLSKSPTSGSMGFEFLPAFETDYFTVDTTKWASAWEGYWSKPFFNDINLDGYLDYYRYTKASSPNLISFLQNSNKKFDIHNKPVQVWKDATLQADQTLYTILGIPYVINDTNYNFSFISEPNLDFNLDGYPDAAFSILARPKTTSVGSNAFLLSYAARAYDKNDVVGTPGLPSAIMLTKNNKFNDLLTTIDMGDGEKVRVGYMNKTQSTDSIVKKPFPVQAVDKPILVVSGVDNLLNDVKQSSLSYDYFTPRLDVKEKRYLGFEKQTKVIENYNKDEAGNPVTNKLEEEIIYKQDYPYVGMPKSIVQKLNGNLISKMSVNDADFVSDSAYPTTKVKVPRIKSFTTEKYEQGKFVSKSIKSETIETRFGNTLESNLVASNVDNTSVFTTNVKAAYYPEDLATWKPGLVKDRTVLTSRTGQTAIQTKTSFEYDDKRRVKKQTDEPDDTSLKTQSDFTYDVYGNPTSITVTGAGNGADTSIGTRKVTYAYEAGTNYVAGTFKTKQTNALNHEEKFTYDALTGQVLTSTDANAKVTTNTIDSIGRILTTKSPDGVLTTNANELCKTYVGVGTNSLECETGEKYKFTSTTTGSAPTISFLNGSNQVTRTMTKAYDNTNYIVARNEYDNNGRLYRSSQPALSNVAYANLQWTSFGYDGLGRLIKTVEPGNRVTKTVINGLEATTTNAKGQNRKEISNIADEVVEVVDHDSKSLKYTRDALGRVIKTTDAANNTIAITLDKKGNKLQQVDPDVGTISYRYNPLGQPVWSKDAKGQQVTYQYDVLGRLIKRTEPDLISEWTWDTSGNGKGKLAKVNSNNGFVENYSYDTFGRPTQIVTGKQIDPKAQASTDPDFIIKWNYDSAGRLLSLVYPTGIGYRNIYDTNGYLREVRDLAGTRLYWAATARDALGHVTSQTLGNGLVSAYKYKTDTGFLESINTGGSTVQQNSYTFDALGNLTNRNQNINGISITEAFTYDNINRIKSIVNQKGLTTTATYDAIGNIASKSDVGTYNYTTGGTSCGVHKVCAISSTTGGLNTSFAYDANGNLLTGNGRTNTWTSFDMPLQIKQGTSTESFLYNADHERVRRVSVDSAGKATTTIYINPRIDVGNTFERSYLPDGSMENTHYIYAGSNVVGSYLTTDKGTAPTADLSTIYKDGVAPNATLGTTLKTGPIRYFHYDHLDSLEAITDSTGSVIERFNYDVWGKRRNLDGTPATGLKSTKTNRGYTLHEMMDNVGLVHMNGRVYDPQVARFLSADPNIDGADNLQGYNRYSYVHNNPATLLDPSGYGFFKKLGRELIRPFKQLGHAIEDAIITINDDWLGNCSSSRGDCGMTVGVTYGPNNTAIGNANSGKTTIQPYIGLTGQNSNYTLNFSYQNGGLDFNSFGYGYNSYDGVGSGIAKLMPAYSIDASFFSNFSRYIYNATGTELGDFLTGIQQDQRQAIDENTPDQAETVVEASLWTTTVGRFPSLGRAGAGISRTLNKLFRPCGCFDDDTPVLTKDGYKRIIEIKEGDLVLARHEEIGEMAYKPVKRVFVVPNRRIYLLKTIDSIGKENIIEVSDDHPFWVVDKKWVNSIDLKEGDQLLDANNQVHKVVSITETDRVETTYNLEVEGYHTYFAGDASIWVHNCNLDKISTGRTVANNLKERLAMEQVKSNPQGVTPPRMPKMSDSKNGLYHEDGWVKRAQNVNGVEIHYVENVKTGQKGDFKFKDK